MSTKLRALPATEGASLPPSVARQLGAFQQQIGALEQARQQYLLGVFAALGVDGPVEIDFQAMTYRVRDERPDSGD